MSKLPNESALPPFKEGRGGSSGWGGSSLLPPSKEGRGGSSYKNADSMEYGLLKAYARENRKNMTLAERFLWNQLKCKALGVTFFRQYIIGDFITDFACLKPRLVIEVDGGYHSEPQQIEDDAVRQARIEVYGFSVIRFTNEEILFDIDNTINKIENTLELLNKRGNNIP